MKTLYLTSLLLSSIVGAGFAHADDMNGMDMQNMSNKNMPMADQKDEKTYHAVGIVKKVDPAKRSVTIAHEPIVSLHWPAMTMPFFVKEKKLFDKLVEGKQVEFDFVQENGKSTIISAK